MEVSYNFIKISVIKPSCMREGKNKRKKKGRRTLHGVCRFQIMSKKACNGIRCVSVLNPVHASFLKMNQIVFALCKCLVSKL